ncbi:MAG: arylsulfatase [Cyclobacteriaceae bacterium]|nr:arylsulfatase [Cyclobacteriaceae bacterium]
MKSVKFVFIGILLFIVSNLFAQQKPNIIIILADDLGYGDVGFNGGEKIKTPTLDQMAREGVVFTRHYAGSSVCGPSRASLMTGFHTGNATVRGNPAWTASGVPVDLGSDDITVAEELKRAGYKTGIIGKWGLAENLDEGMPLKQGFDYFYGFATHRAAHHYYPEETWENDKLTRIEGNDTYNKIGIYSQDLFIEKAIDFIDKNHKEPFFLYFATQIPHYELTIPENEKQYYLNLDWPLRKMTPGHYRHDENGFVTYAAMVTRMDNDIARIMEKLKEVSIDENTLVIFTSDNGHEFDHRNNGFLNSNGPLRGGKRDLYEGGIRIPFVARWPAKIQKGTQSEHASAFWDYLPTLCEVAGIESTVKTDGISFLPSLLGHKEEQLKHDYLYWEFNERQGPIQVVTKGYWKLIYFHIKNEYELYNLEHDISEQFNLALAYPELLEEMKTLMHSARSKHPDFPLVPHPKLND